MQPSPAYPVPPASDSVPASVPTGETDPFSGPKALPPRPWLTKAAEAGVNLEGVPQWKVSTKWPNGRPWFHPKMVGDQALCWVRPSDWCDTAEHMVKWKKWDKKTPREKLVKLAKKTPEGLLSIPLMLLYLVTLPGGRCGQVRDVQDRR